jgi:hypothetical protein
MPVNLRIHGTLDEQLARCDREIRLREAYLSNPDNPDRSGAERGLLDWLVNRQDVLAELKANELRIKREAALPKRPARTRTGNRKRAGSVRTLQAGCARFLG